MDSGNNALPAPRGRPFQKGNPGRRKGSKHKITVLAEKLLAKDAKDIVVAVIKAAKNSDPTAMKLCIERICQPRKGALVSFPMMPVKTLEDVAAAQSGLLEAVGQSLLTPAESVELSTVIERLGKALEASDLSARIARLEAAEARRTG